MQIPVFRMWDAHCKRRDVGQGVASGAGTPRRDLLILEIKRDSKTKDIIWRPALKMMKNDFFSNLSIVLF